MKLINAGIELATLFQRYARKVLMREGEGIMKIPSKKKVNDFAENIYQDFKSSGVPNNVIKTEKDIGKFHKQITDIEEKARKKWWDNQLKKPPELADIFDLQGNQIRDTSKIMGGKEIQGTPQEKINWLVKNVDPNAEQTIPPKATLEAMLKDGREDLIDHFFEMHTKELGKPKINIDTSGLKHPELVKKMMMDKKLKPTLVEKLDPALYEDRGGNIIPAQFGIHPNSEIAKSLRLEAEAAKKLKNMSEAEIKLRGNRPYDTDEQIIARIEKQNKEAAERLRNKKNKDPDEPEGFYQGGQAQIEPDLSGIGHGSDALMARNMLIAPGSQATTSTGLNYLLGEDNDTTRVPYNEGLKVEGPDPRVLELMLNEKMSYPEALKEIENRMKQQPYIDERYNMGPGPILEAAEGGRAGYNEGNMVLPKPKAMDEYLLKQVMSQAGANTLDVRTREMFIEELKKKIRNKRAAEEKKYQFEELRDQGAQDMYYDNREKELDIKYNPQNYPPSMRKFAGGGVAGLLGEGPGSTDHGPRTNYKEAGAVDKIGGMVNYKNVPHYLAKPLKGVTNIAEWMGRLPFAATELASDMIRKPLFKAGDKIPGLPGVGAKFVGGEMFEKFGNNMETGALAEKLGLTALADKTGENLTDEARTVGDLLESAGEFANVGGILAAGKNLFKGGDSLKKLSQSMGKVKDNKTLEKLVDETLTARGEGRRDFNKLVASGGVMVALQSIGLGGIKAAKTKAAPEAVLTLRTIIDDSDVMTENGLQAIGREGSLIDVSGLTDAVKKSLAVIMKNRKNTFGNKVVRNKVKGKDGKFTEDYEDIPTEEAAYIMEELQKRGHNVKLEHYDDMGGQGVDDLLNKFKNKDKTYGKDNYDKFSKKVAKMTDKEKFAYHSSITDDSGNYYDEFVEELLDMNFKNSTK
jgi:hypothetical protein